MFTNVYGTDHHLGSEIAFDGRHIANICVPCFIGHYMDSCFDYVVVAHYEYMHVFISVIMAECSNWTQKDLVRAVDDIKVNKLSYRNATKKYGISKSTLCDYVLWKVEIGCEEGEELVRGEEEG